MLDVIQRRLKKHVKRGLAHYGIVISRGHDWSKVENFIPFEETLPKARAGGMSVGDWIDAKLSKTPGSTQTTIDRMKELGVFAGARTIAEIGPGSGRYLERTIALAAPSRYEIYETATDWCRYLTETYPVVALPTDGMSMAATADASIGLVQAHKVFSTVPFIATCRYWLEMLRVTRPGGFIVFDCMTEACVTPALIPVWAGAEMPNASYPAVMPSSVIVAFFESRGASLHGRFFTPMPPTQTEVFVFKR